MDLRDPVARMLNTCLIGRLVLQQIELVTVQRLFHRIDVTVHLVIGILLGDDIALSYRPSVTLLQVGRPSGYV